MIDLAEASEAPPTEARLFHAAFSTDGLPQRERHAAVRGALMGMVDTVPSAGTFDLAVDTYLLNPFTVVHARGSAQRTVRRAERIALDGVDMLSMHLLLDGEGEVDADGRASISRPGDIVVLDWSRPFVTQDRQAFDQVSIMAPRSTIAELTPRPADLHGLLLGPDTAGLLAGFLRALLPTLPRTRAEDGGVLARIILDLLALTLGRGPVGPPAPASWEETTQALLDRATSWIDRNLNAEPMTPADVAEGLGVSRTRLYKAFESTGGVAQHILKRRLGRVHHALLNPAETRGVETLAIAAGFSSTTHFARVFRAAYGLTPSDLRRRVSAPMG